ncbi:Hypothetical predicted protein [Octopus vulgaris]|uniref:Transmembrane protein n=1 Tax=Octopus vulgaris TaxID=6645 RepID=A0AA36EZH4_OCTVU|nr:Hypothetical predicted protein [Octopus vulgaris]
MFWIEYGTVWALDDEYVFVYLVPPPLLILPLNSNICSTVYNTNMVLLLLIDVVDIVVAVVVMGMDLA